MAFNNSNIQFLQGSYNALKQLETSQPGAFYVTNDTHEMFLGVDATKPPVALNRWVDVKADWDAVQKTTDYREHPGKLYYAIKENILCTWNATKNQWVQINPDTNDNTSVASISFAGSPTPVKNNETGEITGYKYTLSLQEKNKDDNNIGTALTADFTITNDMVTSLVVNVAVGLEASIETNKATIKTVGAGNDDTKAVTLTGDNGVTISGSGSDIKITGTTYNLTSPVEDLAQVILKNAKTENTVGAVVFEGDGTWINTAPNGADKIKIEHAGPGTAVDYTIADATDVTIGAIDRKFTALTGIQKDAKGHIVGVTQTEFTVPNSNFELGAENGKVSVTNVVDGKEVTEEAEFTRQVELRDAVSNNVISETDVKTAHTITVDGVKKIVANSGDFGSFYSSTEIDRILRTANALTYKGTVDSVDELPTSGVSLGDTYKASTAFGDYKVGDLLIANGASEDEDGYIEGSITWDHIATGEDTDSQYKVQGALDQIQLVHANGENKDNVASYITVTDDNKHILATVADNELKIEHITKNFSDVNNATATPTAGGTVAVVTDIDKDDAGHIDGVTTTTITLPGADKVVRTKDHFVITDAEDNTKGDLHFVNKLSGDADNHKISVNTEVDDTNKSLRVTFNHDTQNVVESTENKDKDIDLSAKDDEDRTFSVLESVSYDDYGHITGYQAKDITIGKQSAYDLTEPSITNNVVTQIMERDGGNKVGSINLASDTLTYSLKTVGDTTLTQINIVWGSFETTV